MAINTLKITSSDTAGKTISSLSDTPSADGMSAEALKAQFDALSNLIIQRLNGVIDGLVALTGGAEIGASVNGFTNTNVSGILAEIQGIVVDLQEQIDDKGPSIIIDSAPIINSPNAVSSGGVYQALQDMSISGGVVVDSVLMDSPNPIQNAVVYNEFNTVKADLEDKVDKEAGKGLSTNDYTTAEKTKLDGIARFTKNVTLTVAGWTQVSDNYQVLTTVDGIKASDNPHITLAWGGNAENYLQQQADWGKVSYAQAAENGILFVCLQEKPEVELNLVVEVVR